MCRSRRCSLKGTRGSGSGHVLKRRQARNVYRNRQSGRIEKPGSGLTPVRFLPLRLRYLQILRPSWLSGLSLLLSNHSTQAIKNAFFVGLVRNSASVPKTSMLRPPHTPTATPLSDSTISPTRSHGSVTNIKSFIAEKAPSSDNQFAAAVAYYYRFEAPEAARKEAITADDLQEACRLAGRTRVAKPAQTLINAHNGGLLDKAAERGSYAISTVGENLVPMALPSGSGAKPRGAQKSTSKSPAKKSGKASKK